MYPLLTLLFVVALSPFQTVPPDPYWTHLTEINMEWDTHPEGYERIFHIQVGDPAEYAAATEPGHYSGMGNGTTDVAQWAPLIAGHFSDLGQEAVDMATRIMVCESGGNPHARNPRSTATGLMQIMASIWGEHFGLSRADLESPELNLWVAREVYEIQGWNAWTCWRR
jgi:hypothetical protein